jgi:hypothetical protein
MFDFKAEHKLEVFDDSLVGTVTTQSGQPFFMGRQFSGSVCLQCGKGSKTNGGRCCDARQVLQHQAVQATSTTWSFVQDWEYVNYEALCKHDFDQAALHGDTEDITMSHALQAEFTRNTGPNEPSWSKWSLEECKRGGKKGGTASVETARESEPRNPDHVMKSTGERAANDLEQHTSEGGSASVEKARESEPRSPDHVMKSTGMRTANDLEQRCSEGGKIGTATMVDDGNGNPVRACVKGGSASVENARESEPRNPDHVMKSTGERAVNDLQQRCSEGGLAGSSRPKRRPRRRQNGLEARGRRRRPKTSTPTPRTRTVSTPGGRRKA